MAILSLNGAFDYPVEIKQSLIVDKIASFGDAIKHGIGNGNAAQYSFVSGDRCVANGLYSFSTGLCSYTNAEYSRADGFQCSGFGEYSRAYGYNAKSDNERSFVWQGVRIDTPFTDKGPGTFCINPQFDSGSEPICGFYVGDSCITDYISSHSAKRILTNPNIGDNGFTESQEFGKEVFLSGPVTAKSTFEFTNGSDVIFNGSTYVANNNDINSEITNSVASISYARGIALSAVSNLGGYYPEEKDIDTLDFEKMKNFSVPLYFLKSYVTSSVNNPKAFYDGVDNDNLTVGGTNAATRDYSFNLATSASTHTLTSNNSFIGDNRFGKVEIIGKNAITLSNESSADFRYGTLLINEPSSLEDTYQYVPATERFARGVATSGVNHILNEGNRYGRNSSDINTYIATSRFVGPVSFNGSVFLSSSAIADFTDGILYVKSPPKTSMKDNEPATTRFTRETALSAIDTLLEKGGKFGDKSRVTFNGNVTFNRSVDFASPIGVQVDVKTQSINTKGSTFAASTKYVQDYVIDTISTSSISVKNLILNGDKTSKTNNFTTVNDFRGGDILVNTMDDTEEYDHYAASCEFVKNKVGNISIFNLFDMKYLDYKLEGSKIWKMAGSFLSKKDYPNAYYHILRDIDGVPMVMKKVGEYDIPCYTAKDGHNIVLIQYKETYVEKIFEKTGIAWFYLINTSPGEEGIYLPRTKYNFDITLNSDAVNIDVGEYIKPELPSHTHKVSFPIGYGPDGSHGGTIHHGSGSCGHININTVTDSPGGIYTGKTNIVQPPATKVFLYFYCG